MLGWWWWYVVYWCDRDRIATNKKDGGGVLIAVSKSLRSESVVANILCDTHSENIFVQLLFSNHEKYLISAVYIPPKSSEDVYSSYFESVQYLIDKLHTSNIYLLGDYNQPDIDWIPMANNSITSLYNSSSSICKHLDNFMSLLDASQYNNIFNSKNHLLDLLISNSDCIIYTPACPLLPPDNYHPPFCAIIKYKSKFQTLMQAKIIKYN